MHGLAKKAIAAVLFYAWTTTYISAQTAGTPPSSPAEMAKALARTIDANTIRSQGPIVFKSVTAHDNIVELEYAVKDAIGFSNNKANLGTTRLGLARYYCSASRVFLLNSGVVIHEVLWAPDDRDRIEITIDRSSCATLPVPKLADAETLGRMAQAVAARENKEGGGSLTKGPFQFDSASAHGGLVELNFIVTDTSAGQNVKAKPAQWMGILTGYFCGKYSDDLGQGFRSMRSLHLPTAFP